MARGYREVYGIEGYERLFPPAQRINNFTPPLPDVIIFIIMKKNMRLFLSFLVGVSLIGLIITIFINFRLRKGFETIAHIKGATINKVRYSGTRDNRKEWELEAKSATQLKDRDVVMLESVRLVYYAKGGFDYTLTGREGSYSMDSGEITVTGDVVVVSRDGYTLLTDSLTYSTSSKTVSTKERVSISSPKMDVTGRGLTMEVESERMSVLSEVKTVLKDASI